ncbi:hypothetical protein BJX63DRAFT_270304 [Aspergillus granulosus]|uniref:Uncharacterized protein n=1 Tax=Aspergillus granulosus TaxID=176169 RepID=A0ABR4HA71_9EURO
MPILGLMRRLELVGPRPLKKKKKPPSNLAWLPTGKRLRKKVNDETITCLVPSRKLLPTGLAHWRYIIYSSTASTFPPTGRFGSGSSFHLHISDSLRVTHAELLYTALAIWQVRFVPTIICSGDFQNHNSLSSPVTPPTQWPENSRVRASSDSYPRGTSLSAANPAPGLVQLLG